MKMISKGEKIYNLHSVEVLFLRFLHASEGKTEDASVIKLHNAHAGLSNGFAHMA